MTPLKIREPKTFLFLCALIAGILVLLAKLLMEKGIPLPVTAWGLGAFALVFLIYISLGCTSILETVRSQTRSSRYRIFSFVGLLIIPYVIYAWGTGDGTWVNAAKLLLYLTIPTLVLWRNPEDNQKMGWREGLALLVLWAGVEFGQLQSLWNWPEGMGRNVYAVPLAISLSVLLFVGFRRLEGVGFQFRYFAGDGRNVAVNLGVFLCIAIPVGLFTDFIHWTERPFSPLFMAQTYVATFFLVALPEEVFFRGLIQNLLQKTMKNQWVALVTASILFGLTHWNNTPSPDWRYLLLATIAGIFYGRAYNRSSTLMAAVTVHTLVDTIWVVFFR